MFEEVESHRLSKRDISFDQQRALLRQDSLEIRTTISGLERASFNKESNLDSTRCSLGRINTTKFWRSVKPTRIRLPCASTEGLSLGTSQSRKVTPSRRGESASCISKAVVKLPVGVCAKNAYRVDKRNSTSSRTAVLSVIQDTTGPNPERQKSHWDGNWERRERTTSLVISLHDPLKDRTFTEECRDMLKGLESEKHLLNIGVTSTPVNRPRKTSNSADAKISNQLSFEDRYTYPQPSLEALGDMARSDSPSPSIFPTQIPFATSLDTTSGGIAKVTQLTEISRASDGATIADEAMLRADVPHPANVTSALHPVPSRTVVRLPSASSVMSTDTLSGIEAQIHTKSRVEIISKTQVQPVESAIISPKKMNSGSPPNTPLPAVPLEAGNTQSETKGSAVDAKTVSLQRRESAATAVDFVRYTLREPRATDVRERRIRDLAKLRSLSPAFDMRKDDKTSHTQILVPDPISYTPVNEIWDELDLFPAAPKCRPSHMGRTLVSSNHRGQLSPGKDHVRQLQWVPPRSMVHLPQARSEILARSNIFIVVDTDLETTDFGAGVTSPTPSVGSKPHRQSPAFISKYTHPEEYITNQEDRLCVTEPAAILRNLKQTQTLSPERSVPHSYDSQRRPATDNSSRHSTSSDEQLTKSSSVILPPTAPGKMKRPRKWNSSDTKVENLLQQDLEDIFAITRQQQKKIKWQTLQIQILSQAFTPESRSQGVRPLALPQGSSKLPQMEVEFQSAQYSNKTSWFRLKDCRQKCNVRSSLNTVEEQALNGQDSEEPQRPNTTLESSSMTLIPCGSNGTSVKVSPNNNPTVNGPGFETKSDIGSSRTL